MCIAFKSIFQSKYLLQCELKIESDTVYWTSVNQCWRVNDMRSPEGEQRWGRLPSLLVRKLITLSVHCEGGEGWRMGWSSPLEAPWWHQSNGTHSGKSTEKGKPLFVLITLPPCPSLRPRSRISFHQRQSFSVNVPGVSWDEFLMHVEDMKKPHSKSCRGALTKSRTVFSRHLCFYSGLLDDESGSCCFPPTDSSLYLASKK